VILHKKWTETCGYQGGSEGEAIGHVDKIERGSAGQAIKETRGGGGKLDFRIENGTENMLYCNIILITQLQPNC